MINKDSYSKSTMSALNSILVTGGAGYIGSVLTKKLVENRYKVRILDSAIYGLSGISQFVDNKNVELILGDVRNEEIIRKSVKDIDCIIHLAAIVGEPLCNKIPEAARQINEFATKKLVTISKSEGVRRFVFASTCSNYGSSETPVNETSQLQSLSLYSETKVKSESFVMSSKDPDFEPCVLRFATAFGLSPRMRFDLLLQEFIRDAVVNKKIAVFGPHYWRPLVHVDDISNACIKAISSSAEKISGQVYNVGSNDQNYTKLDLAKIIQNFIPDITIEIQELKKDPRNYRVSFDKITHNLQFKITKTVKDGVSEILEKIRNGKLDPRESEFSNMSKLTEKVQVY
jgi:nucleoside-diphosphate-sugar epimerase